jgi:hypothetical protein
VTDPVQAALWLVVAAVTVLILCLGGTLIAAGLVHRPAPHGPRSRQPATKQSHPQLQ